MRTMDPERSIRSDLVAGNGEAINGTGAVGWAKGHLTATTTVRNADFTSRQRAPPANLIVGAWLPKDSG